MRYFAALLAAAALAPAQGPVDTSADPCADFYQYACGPWMRQNPLPADEPEWASFTVVQERNEKILREILEQAARPDPKRDANDQKIGDYYAGCMDEQAIERHGPAPLKPELDRIAALRDKSQLAGELVRLHRMGIEALFAFTSSQDFRNSQQMIAELDQGGLGLPDRDYYLNSGAKFSEIRSEYVRHIANMLRLLGDSPDRAAAEAKAVMSLETALAKGSLDRVSLRDPAKIYHKMTPEELAALAPSFRWTEYLKGIGAPPLAALNVAEPDFARAAGSLIGAATLEDWRTYLRWHLVARAPMMPKAFVDERFAFSRVLTGARELPPRWKRCVEAVDGQLGEALGRKFVERTFGGNAKQRTLDMVNELEASLAGDLGRVDWMSPATKNQALAKLRAITNKIGYPDHWRDYGALSIIRGDAFGNAIRGREFEFQRELNRIGKPVDRGEWLMTPPTVDAYYDPQMNNINFPAGMLQPPFFDNSRDDAANLGAIGGVIGHELTHGFDDQGRQFDGEGNLRDWWTPEDAKEFEQRAECFVKEYSGFSAVDDVKLNGHLTLGENTADNGGLRLAYMTLMKLLAGKPEGTKNGYTAAQRFFLAYGQIWCANQSAEFARTSATVDTHSPPRARVNGVVSNMPEFQRAFACHVGQPMVRAPACRVW